ncbi:hypothetical protein [Ferrovibrio sp.]|uniref:hypothetical protein n=1 Tax=Ferrovibrio sp. TaxID=1917215 RepID=UPI003120100F
MTLRNGDKLSLKAEDGQTRTVVLGNDVVATWLRYQPVLLKDDAWTGYRAVAAHEEGDTVFRRAQLIPLQPAIRNLLRNGTPGSFVDIAPVAGMLALLLHRQVEPGRFWRGKLSLAGEAADPSDAPPPGYADYFGLRTAARPLPPYPVHPASRSEAGDAAGLAGLLPPQIAFARLSAHLARPTGILLPAMLERLAPGGMILLADYDYADFPGATAAIDRLLADRDGGLFLPLPLGGGIWMRN